MYHIQSGSRLCVLHKLSISYSRSQYRLLQVQRHYAILRNTLKLLLWLCLHFGAFDQNDTTILLNESICNPPSSLYVDNDIHRYIIQQLLYTISVMSSKLERYHFVLFSYGADV